MALDEKEEKIRQASAAWYGSGASYAVLCVVAWFTFNMIIANLNKWIYHRYAFRHSALLTTLHMAACYTLSALALRLRGGAPRPPLSPRARHAVLQLALVFVVSVCFGNAALGFIHVSFSQAIGATAPLWTVVFSIALTRRSYPQLVWTSLGLICVGMILTIRGEINFHPVGFVLVLAATLTRSLKSILQGMLLSAVEERLDTLELLYHMAPRSAGWLLGYVLLFEGDCLHDEKLRDGGLWLCILASSLVSFFLNIANFLVTKATSPVTLQVLGNIKVVMLIVLSVAIFGNEISVQAGCGCAICLSGVFLYNQGLRSASPVQKRPDTPGSRC